jgi:hypothetical protein
MKLQAAHTKHRWIEMKICGGKERREKKARRG